MKWMKPKMTFRFLFSLTIAVVFMILLLFSYLIQLPKAKQNISVLETAIYTITPPPQVTPFFCSSFYKTDRATVECSYKTDLVHDQIESFYTEALSAQGWRYTGSNTVPNTPNYLKSAIYCKENYTAELDYSPRGYPYSYDFSMSWSWGSHHCR